MWKKTRANCFEQNAFGNESGAFFPRFLICNVVNLTYNLALS